MAFYRTCLIKAVGLLSLIFSAGIAHAAVVGTELSLLSESFLSPGYDSSPASNYQFIGANFQTNPEAPADFVIDFQGAYAIGAPLLSYLNMRELAYRFPIAEGQTFVIGRKLVRWSELDRRWNFGVIEPVFEWNPLSPESQGLTGLYWEFQKEGVKMMLFGSFFFVPDQGPSFEIDSNGEFSQGNPWFHRPPESIRAMDEVSRIEYNFERPSETEVVFQTSYGARIDLGDEGPWRARFAFLYKPMNQLALGYDGDLGNDAGYVTILPKVGFHNVRSADFAYIGDTVAVGLSAMQDAPTDRVLFTDMYTRPSFSMANILSPWIDIRLGRGWSMTIQRLDMSGGEIIEVGELANPSRAPITTRYPFKEANQISVDFDRRVFKNRRLGLKASYTQSERNEFQMLRWGGRLQLTRLWNVQAEMILVDATDVITKDNRSDIADYKNNDRLQFGVGYVF